MLICESLANLESRLAFSSSYDVWYLLKIKISMYIIVDFAQRFQASYFYACFLTIRLFVSIVTPTILAPSKMVIINTVRIVLPLN
jgi:hypothetical protein